MSVRNGIAVALVCSLGTAAPALADEQNEEPQQALVTASKIKKPANEMTHSVTVVSEEQIEKQVFTDVTEILRQQAGLEFKQVGGPGQFNYLKLRGLAADNVLVIVDGVKINTASGGNTRNLLSQLSPDVIESLEIVRGPQATLYGANSTAGVIVIKTKSGQHKNANISLEAGSLEWRKAAGSWRTHLPIGSGELQYAANLSRTDSDNIHQYEYFKDESLQLKLDYQSDRWAIGGSFWKVDNDFGYAELDEASCCMTEATFWSFQTPDPDQHSETGATIGSVYFDFNFTDRLKQQVRFGRTETTYTTTDRNDGLLGYQIAPVALPANVTGNPAPVAAGSRIPIYDRTSDSWSFAEDYRNQAEYELLFTGQRFSLMGGLEFQEQGANQRGTNGASDTDDSQSSLYTNGDVRLLGGKLILSMGVRLDDYESWGRETTGNIGFAWQLASPVNLYANFGTSFKPATMSQLFSPTSGNPKVKPESGRTIELGVRLTALDRRLETEAAFWDSKIDDVIFFDNSIVNTRATRPCTFNPALTCGLYNNGAEGKTSGVEVKGSYQISGSISLYGNYTYTDSQTRAVGGAWLRTVQIAHNKANLGVSYDSEALKLGANIYYTGPRLRWAGDLETARYARVDISGRYQISKALSLSARVENLLDDDYLDELGYAETGRYGIFGVEYRFF
jgi:outer membrane cobalamin receptor